MTAESSKSEIAAAIDSVTAHWNYAEGSSPKTGATTNKVVISRCGIVTLAVTLPGVAESTFEQWLGRRLVVHRESWQGRRHTAILSSRTGSRPDKAPNWFHALRTAVLRCDPRQDSLCVAEGTASAEAVGRASELFGVPRTQIVVATDSAGSIEELKQWLRSILTGKHVAAKNGPADVYLSPELIINGTVKKSPPGRSAADAALILAAQRIIVLQTRQGGHIESLLSRYLSSGPSTSVAPVLLAQVDKRASASGSAQLVAAGAVPWLLATDGISNKPKQETAPADCGAGPDRSEKPAQKLTLGPLENPEGWLCHWTRPQSGPWVDQSQEEFLDELILGSDAADRSALAALIRIIHRGILLATPAISEALPTVSWTAVPLAEFRALHVYRKHKRRFDFEPWGIAARKSWLESKGCRPVTYLNSNQTAADCQLGREFVQPTKNGRKTIDWSQEREWRVCGNVDLRDAPVTDVVIFTDTDAARRRLQSLSPWTVLTLPR